MSASMTTRYKWIDSPVGKVWVAWRDEALVSVGFEDQPKGAQLDSAWEYDTSLECEAIDQLTAYFAGTLRNFTVPLAPKGTDFQQRVWGELAKIDYGVTVTYGSIAKKLGKPSASRAVGAANGKNPIAIILPCHRVIGQSGKLTGYAGGIDKKEILLRFERDHLLS
ncbi:MAG: methylated-DNA-[protein]-cysteine S-methyltransferase [Myxococcota bacterium]|jgi:methylated-DNA-[protein]-cysteine S-methyltransferase